MTVLPGSLDYLYYNGILDHIPYEAYERVMPSPSMYASGMGYPMNNTAYYMDAIQQGEMYNNWNSPDTYNGNPYNYSSRRETPEESVSFKDRIKAGTEKLKNPFADKSIMWKGLIGAGLIATTLFCLLRGKKPPKP